MFRISRNKQWPAVMDLSTVRETLIYMRDDMKRIQGLEGASEAIDKALAEIREAEAKQPPRQTLPPQMARFLPRSYIGPTK